MTYQEIRTALKSFQAQGYPAPALNSKREILESALAELQALTTVETVATPIEETPEIIPAVVVEVTPVAIAPSPIPTPKRISPEHPAISELREYARITGVILVWSFAITRSLIRFSIPHLVRGLGFALRIAVTTAVILQIWLVPKIKLVAYQLGLWLLPRIEIAFYTVGIWVLTTALRGIRWRGMAIA